MAFDENRYKKIFDERYGAGSFDASLSDARKTGSLKAEVSFAKKEYQARIQAAKKAQKEAEKEEKERIKREEKRLKEERENEKIYGDITAKEAGEMRKKAQAQGRGGFQPTYKNKVKEQKAIAKAKEKQEQELFPDMSKWTPYAQEQYYKQQQKAKKKEPGLMDRLENLLPKKKETKKDNWYIDLHKKVDDKLFKPIEDKVGRFATNMADGVAGGQVKKSLKKRETPDFMKPWTAPAKTKAEKGVDIAGQFAGMAAPIGAAYKVTKPAATGMFQVLSRGKDLGKAGKYIQDAIKGSTALGAYSTAREGLDEVLNPNDATLMDRARTVSMEAALGAIGDPAFRLAGRGIKKGAQDVLSRFAKGEVPSFTGKPSESVLNSLKPKESPVVPKLSERNLTNNLYDKLMVKKQPEVAAGKAFEAIRPAKDNGGSLVRLKESLPKEMPSSENIKSIKDINQFQVGTTDLYRLAKKLPPEYEKRITGSLDSAKEAYVKTQTKLTNDLYENVVKKLGVKKGSKESALVQDYGEKTLVKRYLRKRGMDPSNMDPKELEKINLQQLKKSYPNSWQKIVEADAYFRKNYDILIDEVNKVRAQIYPNNPEKLVPKRTDYYHHFKELSDLEGLKNLFDTPSNIDPRLEGVSPFTKPRTKFQGFMQERKMGKYKSDAVGGYLRYLQAASHSIHVDPVIPTLRKTAKELGEATVESRNANKIIELLQDQANDIAGKTNPYDRVTQKTIGRKGMGALTWANSRVKSNMVLGNLSSALGQLGNVPLGIGKAKQHSIPGLKDTVTQTAKELLRMEKNAPIYKSNFLKERYSDQLYRRFDQKLLDQPKKLAVWILETADKAGTRFVWNSLYNKGVAKKVADPIKFADYETRNIVAGRGVGEVPLMQKSKTFQVAAPFTLEVGNQWRVLKELVGEKDAAGLITFAIASYGMNKGAEYVRGSGISFDPVGAIMDGYDKKDGDTKAKILHALASLNGEIVGNIPGGNLLTQFANTEKNIPMTDTKFKDLFGENNPNRFGTGLTVAKAIEDPLFAAMPFGAYQFRKSSRGADAILSDGIYKGDNSFIPFTGDKAELKFPINDKNFAKSLQMLTLGPNAAPEAREYYDNKRRPLSEKQTSEYHQYKQQEMANEYYRNLMQRRRTDTLKNQIKEVQKDQSLTYEEKQAEILRLMAELQKQ